MNEEDLTINAVVIVLPPEYKLPACKNVTAPTATFWEYFPLSMKVMVILAVLVDITAIALLIKYLV